MAKTKEIEIICESAQCYSTYEGKIRVVVYVDNNQLYGLINSIPKEELYKHLEDEVFEELAAEKGFAKVAP